MSEAATISDVHEHSNTRPASVRQDDEGNWIVSDNVTTESFHTEEAADERAAASTFVAHECTERLYRYVEKSGMPDGWSRDEAGKADLDGEATLPHIFYDRSGGVVVRYWYLSQETYETHERCEDEHGRQY